MRQKRGTIARARILFLAVCLIVAVLYGFDSSSSPRFGRDTTRRVLALAGVYDGETAVVKGSRPASIPTLPDAATRLFRQPDPASNITLPDSPLSADSSSSIPAMSDTKTIETRKGDARRLKQARRYINAIMSPNDTTFPRLSCPVPSGRRYENLRGISIMSTSSTRPKYFFALDLYQCVNLLPRLLGSVVEAIRFLGPENCVLSIVEGRSSDGTFETLQLLAKEMVDMGTEYFLSSSNVDPSDGGRIDKLADLRNQALKPLTSRPDVYSPTTSVIFLNDVSLCLEDILELIYQREFLKADMTCAMDWAYVGSNPTFYDVWIARTMVGDTFFHIPTDGNWDSAWNLFWNEPLAYRRWAAYRPFQVFSCWNGAVVLDATPFLQNQLAFRAPRKDECFQGEPQLLCKDLWGQGSGKIAVVPSVNIGYDDEDSSRLKRSEGYVKNTVDENGEDGKGGWIEWQVEPPELVKCMPNHGDQSWRAWNE